MWCRAESKSPATTSRRKAGSRSTSGISIHSTGNIHLFEYRLMRRAVIGLYVFALGALCGCAGSLTESKFTKPPHAGNILELPDAQGFVELKTDLGASPKKGSREKRKSQIFAYFYQPDGSTAMSPAPTDVKVTFGAAGSGTVVNLAAQATEPSEFASALATTPMSSEARSTCNSVASLCRPLFRFGEIQSRIDGRSSFMPTVTVEGEKSFEVEAGKKLVLAIEDAGIDIMHKCGGNARCTTCRVAGLGRRAAAHGAARARAAGTRNKPRAQYALIVPDPRRIRPVGRGRQPFQPDRHSRRNASARLNPGGTPRTIVSNRRPPAWSAVLLCFCGSAQCLHRTCAYALATHSASTDDTWPVWFFFLRGRNGTGHLGTIVSVNSVREPVVARPTSRRTRPTASPAIELREVYPIAGRTG